MGEQTTNQLFSWTFPPLFTELAVETLR